MGNYVIDSQAIGARIKKLRLKLNKTQNYFADILYISPSYLALIEAGKRVPNIDTLVHISQVTDVSLDYLILGKEEDSKSRNQRTFDRLSKTYSEKELRLALRLAEYYLRLSKLKDEDTEIVL